ncbi:aminotransferase [Leptolyngbya sp. 'hensonii']|uniref:type 1 glutamine amidotransferase n=1 Tax=Leptolyngbya sp. 'hensonii' TaxID=1922337 RepID=UPI00094FC4D8|nr:type 1 glutamine amidotransferase [Leptolyngbya sp. 'hensonii']OLP16185.1 aminotransferase [Leptolyngbya sp. 'hensonii']
MAKQRSQLKILLLQIRDDDQTRQEEFDQFVRYSHLESQQFQVLDVFATPEFDPTCVDGYDALFVGGSSDASVTQPDRYPFVHPTEQLLIHCMQTGLPVFASCFGFQAAVTALGGQVIVDKASMEIGAYPLWLTNAAAEDLLFHDVPDGFWAIAGHKERAAAMPQDAILLAYSDRCPYHAFKIADRPFYGFQFHPELDAQDLTIRITRYCDRYLNHQDELKAIVQNLRETPISQEFIAKFVDRILL